MKLSCILSKPDCERQSEYEVCKKCGYDFGVSRVSIENKQQDIDQAGLTYLNNKVLQLEQDNLSLKNTPPKITYVPTPEPVSVPTTAQADWPFPTGVKEPVPTRIAVPTKKWILLGLAVLVLVSIVGFAVYSTTHKNAEKLMQALLDEKTKALLIEPEMVVIPSGKFTMGSTEEERQRAIASGATLENVKDEISQREIKIKSFEISRTEVTKSQFEQFVKETNSVIDGGCYFWDKTEWKLDANRNWKNPGFEQLGSHPVSCVSWDDAQKYIEWLNKKTGKAYRLASESEFEYVARAGCTTEFNIAGKCTNKIEASQANFDGNYTYNGSEKGANLARTTAVGSYAANGMGVYDIHGNVHEWAQDCYEANYDKGQPTDGAAHRAYDNTCEYRVVRGGSWVNVPDDLRAANRDRFTPAGRGSGVGFRLARTVP